MDPIQSNAFVSKESCKKELSEMFPGKIIVVYSQNRDIKISMTPTAKEYIADAGFDPVYGARPLKRALYEIVEDKLADLILEEKVEDGNSVEFDLKNNEIVVNIS